MASVNLVVLGDVGSATVNRTVGSSRQGLRGVIRLERCDKEIDIEQHILPQAALPVESELEVEDHGQLGVASGILGQGMHEKRVWGAPRIPKYRRV